MIVGIVDTGTDILDDLGAVSPHPDLVNNLWNENGKYGYNVFLPLEIPEDDNGHGTHVAGIISAETNNSPPLGVAGMAGGGFGGDDGVRIMSVKGLRRTGTAFVHEVSPAIEWAANPDGNPNTDDGAHIINMSWRALGNSQTLHVTIQYAHSLGIVLVAAAGNNNQDLDLDPTVYPAVFEEVITIAGTDINDLLSPVSNFGSTIEVCAPAGESLYSQIADNVYSTTPFEPGFYLNQNQGVPHQYAYLGGTSTSAAFVSGLAVLLKSYENNLSPQQKHNFERRYRI